MGTSEYDYLLAISRDVLKLASYENGSDSAHKHKVEEGDRETLARLRSALLARAHTAPRYPHGPHGPHGPYGPYVVVGHEVHAMIMRKLEFDPSRELQGLTRPQRLLRNFVCPRTPYTGLLVFHEVGVGKTRTALAIATQHSPRYRVLVIAGSSARNTFEKEMSRGQPFQVEYAGFMRFSNLVRRMSDTEVARSFRSCVIIVDEAHALRGTNKPVADALQRVSRFGRNTKILLLTATPVFNSAHEIIVLLNLLRQNDGLAAVAERDIFHNDGSVRKEALADACAGYVSYVRGRDPSRFPVVFEASVDGDEGVDLARSRLPGIEIEIIASSMSPTQEKAYASLNSASLNSASLNSASLNSASLNSASTRSTRLEEPAADTADTADTVPEDEDDSKYSAYYARANIVYPNTLGFWACFREEAGTGHGLRVRYVRGLPEFLQRPLIARYACKLDAILSRILKSRGVVLVYSRFLWAGLVPLAIALEHAGFARFGQRNLLATNKNTGAAQYAFLSSDPRLCSKNTFKRSIDAATSPDNANGERVRVVLVSASASESIDLKFIRSVHVMEPWFHMGRFEQVIGRAARNGSHLALPPSERNVTVFRHVALSSMSDTVDVSAISIAQSKMRHVEQVVEVLRASAIDCGVYEDPVVTLPPQTTALGTIVNANVNPKQLLTQEPRCRRAPDGVQKDQTTFDAGFHAPEDVKECARACLELTDSHGMDFDDLAKRLKVDSKILTHALQREVDRGTLLYRGGIYTAA